MKHFSHTRNSAIEVYSIGTGLRGWVAGQRLCRYFGTTLLGYRRTPDRWFRRWQAESTDEFVYLGATRAWTRSGALIRHDRRVCAAMSPSQRRSHR